MILDLLRHGEPEGVFVRSWVICFNADNVRAWKSYKSSAPNG
jgi:hypothetical protein